MRKLNVTNSIFIFLITSVLLVLTAQFFLVHKVVAQTPDNDWSAPENLSYSGSTTNPFMIVDETGVIHAIWEDSFLGYVYNYYDGNLWSPPEAVNFPFDPISTIDLHLMADSNGLLHAYWISIVGNNIEGDMLYSQVNMASIANPDSWRTPQVLADSVVALDGTIDSQERIHIAFVTPFQTEGLEAGAYYTRSAEGNFWTTPESLGSSPYMRTLTTENSSIDITASDINGTTNVYVTWDNRPRQKLFFIKSEDGGDSWGTPNDIVVPESRSGASIPHNIIINAKDDNLLLVWQFGQPDLLCTQHYQWSSDGGETWSETDQMMKDIFGCPQSNQFIAGPGEITLLFTTIDEQVYLLAWDGSTWSNPQAQTPLYSFTDPDTLNDVVYQCRKATLADRDQLYVIGCDGNQVGDIWLTSRLLGSTEDWFPPPSAWTEPANISEEGSVSVLGNILFDNQNISHVIWNQIDFNSTGDKSSKLYYTFWDGIQWNSPTIVQQSGSQTGETPPTILDTQNRLFVVWPGGPSGELTMSRAAASEASSPSEWDEPQIIPSVLPGGRSPDLNMNENGTVFLAYAVPINNNRGIYLTNSMTDGADWNESIQVFDAEAAQWDIVDYPKVALSGSSNIIHILWNRLSLEGSQAPMGLYYTRSADGGKNWLEPELLTQDSAVQAEIISLDENRIHIAWLAENTSNYSLLHQYSLDAGVTWSRISTLSGFDETVKAFKLVADISNRLHLLQITERENAGQTLQHWFWENERWSVDDNLEIGSTPNIVNYSLDSAITHSGRVVSLLTGENLNEENENLAQNIFFTTRLIEIQDETPISLPTYTPTPTFIVEATVLPTQAQPTPTIDVSSLEIQEDPPSLLPFEGSFSGLILGTILAGFIVMIAIGIRYGIRAIKKNDS